MDVGQFKADPLYGGRRMYRTIAAMGSYCGNKIFLAAIAEANEVCNSYGMGHHILRELRWPLPWTASSTASRTARIRRP